MAMRRLALDGLLTAGTEVVFLVARVAATRGFDGLTGVVLMTPPG
jgi:hypothetical protein